MVLTLLLNLLSAHCDVTLILLWKTIHHAKEMWRCNAKNKQKTQSNSKIIKFLQWTISVGLETVWES